MLVTDIKETLKTKSFSEDRSAAFLIDGPWGCGKTFNVQKAVNEEGGEGNRSPHAYVSLFGLNSISEVALCLSEFLDARFISNIDGRYFVQPPFVPKKPNGSFLVFDDLERKGKRLSFEAVFGIVNALRDHGFSVICLVNSKEIKKQRSFRKLADKVFDGLIQVEPDPKVFPKIVKEIKSEYCDSLLRMAKGNWRTLIKADYWYKVARNHITDTGNDAILKGVKVDSYTFSASVLCAVLCVFSSNRKPPQFEKSDQYPEMRYGTLTEKFGHFVTNEFYRLYMVEKAFISNHRELVEILIECILKNDFQILINRYFPKPQESILTEDPFNQVPFYLDDEGKQRLKSAFFERLSDFDFAQDDQERYLVGFLREFLKDLTQQEMETITKHVAECIPEKEQRGFLQMLLFEKPKANSNLDTLEKLLRNAFAEKERVASRKHLDALLSKNDYLSLTDYLYESRYLDDAKKEQISEALALKDYCLPDLSKTLTYESWDYSHEVARFVTFSDSQRDKFVSHLKKLCESSPSKALRKRCNALAEYELHIDIDFVKEFPI